jgi:integrase/recombinase XerD
MLFVEYKMANIKIEIHKRNVEARLESLNKWEVPEEVKTSILDFLNDLELGKVNRGRRISKARQLKYLDMLKNPLEYWNKKIEDLDSKDIESFERDLTTDKILSKRKNQPYSHESKRDIRIALKIFLKWKLGEAKAIELIGWLDTRRINKTPEYLKESEVEKLYKACKNAKERFLLAVLFDSGARAEEFLNVRFEDLEIPKDNASFCRLTLKEEYSKTSGRVISLYWKYTLETVRDYMKEREYSGIKSNDPIFEGTYDSARFFLMRLGKRILNKSIHFHLFRHSSATYYASKLNRQEVCYRYGWKFSSNMPDIYISRAGMESKDLDEKFAATEIEVLQKKLENQEQQRSIEAEDMQNKIKEEVWAQVREQMKEMLDSGKIVMK